MRKLIITLLCTVTLCAAGELSNRRAPGFALPDSKGKVFDLYDYRGKVVVIEFMQTTCPHCAGFADVLEQLYRHYAGKVVVLSIANPPDTDRTVAQYIKGHNISSPVLFDMGQCAYSYLKSMTFDLPQVFIIDPAGMIRADFAYNALNKNIFEGKGLYAEVDKVLAGGAKPAPRKK
jgi:peroxiredoxin